jgi:hypothetical protein
MQNISSGVAEQKMGNDLARAFIRVQNFDSPAPSKIFSA